MAAIAKRLPDRLYQKLISAGETRHYTDSIFEFKYYLPSFAIQNQLPFYLWRNKLQQKHSKLPEYFD